MANLRFSWYSGSKIHFIDKFNNLIKDSNKKIYIEPFVGSAAIFLNLEKDFEEYILNDYSSNVSNMLTTFRNYPYKDYEDCVTKVYKDFGDIKNNKESFYNFRNWYNSVYHRYESYEKYFFLHLLYNSCINSFARFGPNGFNSGYGNRLYTITKEAYEQIQSRLKRATIRNGCYSNVIQDNSLIFLDPPYFERPSSYEKGFKKADLKNFLDIIKQCNSDILYTDIYSDYITDNLKWNFIDSKIIQGASSNSNKIKSREVCYYNFEYNKTNELSEWE